MLPPLGFACPELPPFLASGAHSPWLALATSHQPPGTVSRHPVRPGGGFAYWGYSLWNVFVCTNLKLWLQPPKRWTSTQFFCPSGGNEAEQQTLGSSASGDKAKECTETRSREAFRPCSRDPNRLQTFAGNVTRIQPDTASGGAFTRS